MNAYLVIDIGTSSTKLSYYAEDGRLLESRSRAYPVEYPRADWAEQDAETWWRAVCALNHELRAAAPHVTVRAVSVSGQTPACVPVDSAGAPLRPAILWLDRRASAQVEWLQARLGAERCQQFGLNRLDSYFGGVKWLWFLQNEPELFSRAWKILQPNSFITLRLTGQAVIDPSQAGLCSPCFNLETNQWDEEICAALGLPLAVLPQVLPSRAVAGRVSPEGARASGLPAGTPVVCGGGDFACACLGAGVAGQGQAALMLGTAGNLLFPGVVSRDARLLHTCHVTGEPLTFGGVLCGGALNWFSGLFGQPEPALMRALDEEAAAAPPGADGLVFLPYLMGERTPIWDPAARGAFIGLSARHTRGHLHRAVLEGVACAFRWIAEIGLETGTPLREAVAIDGGANSALWLQILADCLGTPVRQGGKNRGTGLGAAFLAAWACGSVAGSAEIAQWLEPSPCFSPRPEVQPVYDRNFAVYAGLYPKLAADFHTLAG